MKNKFIYYLLFFLICFSYYPTSYSNELKFEASSIEILDKDKFIVAKDGVKILSGDDIVIEADRMRYDKEKKFLNADGNILIINSRENVQINSDKVTYDETKEIIVSSGNVSIKFNNNYSLNSQEVIYLKKTKEILINNNSKIKDSFQNELEIGKLNYNIDNQLLKGKIVKLYDFENNFYNFDSAIIDFSKNQIIADNVSIDFNKNIFGNPSNDPRLKGNYFFSDGKNSIIKKGVFTTCKKNNDCPHGK